MHFAANFAVGCNLLPVVTVSLALHSLCTWMWLWLSKSGETVCLWLGYGNIIPSESGQQECMVVAEVMVETRNVFVLCSCESLLLHGVQIFMFVVLCIIIYSYNVDQ